MSIQAEARPMRQQDATEVLTSPHLPADFARYTTSVPALIKTQSHPTLPLQIHNYTPHTQFRGHWDGVTLAARSLITHAGTGAIVARGFPKFFNAHEAHAYAPTGREFRAEVEEKVDGSLALRFHFVGQWRWASKGSFASAQVRMMEDVWAAQHAGADAALDPHWAYAFELVHPDNVVGVRYGARRALVLLGLFAPDGTEPPPGFDYAALGFPRPRVHDADGGGGGGGGGAVDFEALRRRDAANAEGFVVKFYRTPGDTRPARVKVKFAGYMELVRQKAGVAVAPAALARRYCLARAGVRSFDDAGAVARALDAARQQLRRELVPLADDFGGPPWVAAVLAVWDRVCAAYARDEARYVRVLAELQAEGFAPGEATHPAARAAFARRIASVDERWRPPLFTWLRWGAAGAGAVEQVLAAVTLPEELTDQRTIVLAG